MFGLKKKTGGPPSTASQHGSAADPKLPGSAGYRGNGIGKNAMPENRFKFVRPDGKSQG